MLHSLYPDDLSGHGTLYLVPYIGTSTMWNHDALEEAGGFFETHATENVVTGCNVHQTDKEFDERYISKLLLVPDVAGISPRTLLQLMDQHTRWSLGLVEMASYQRLFKRKFLSQNNLILMKLVAYLATCGGWTSYLLSYFLVLSGTLFASVSTAWFGAVGRVNNIKPSRAPRW